MRNGQQKEMTVEPVVVALNLRGYEGLALVWGRAVVDEVGFEAVVVEAGVQFAAAAAGRQRRMALARGVEYNPAMRPVEGMMVL